VFDEKLASALNFTEEELAANRDRYMTKAQRVRLRREFMRYRVGLALTVGAIWSLIWAWLWLNARDNQNMYLLINVVGVIPLVGNAFSSWRSVKLDLLKGDVAMEAGHIGLQFIGRGISALTIQQVIFSMSSEVLSAFRDGARYRIYYAPHTKHILSAEPMRDDE
jgi:hypothetical protein